jgi:sodium/pantothenate symporter
MSILIPVFAFLALMLVIAFAAQKKARSDFIKEYFIGGRSLGGFVLAMTLVATYSSVSSFVGGPGLAWQRGFGWVYYASIQVVAAFLVLGVVGKKIAVIGRKIDAVTVIDIIRARYGSESLANISALVIVVFFAATMVAQFVGGANLFSAVAGVNYRTGLFIFALIVVLYTSVGGFRGVAITDTICALAMLAGMGLIGFTIIRAGGGIEAVMAKVSENPVRLEPTSGGALSVRFLISQWLLCGFCTLGLPQSLVRNLSYRDSRALHRAMLYGTIVVGAMMIGMHLLGVLSRAVIANVPDGKTTDAIMPTLIAGQLPPLLAGLAIIGPLAATMSTVSSLLIASSSAVIKDLYQYYKGGGGSPPPPGTSAATVALTQQTVHGVAQDTPTLPDECRQDLSCLCAPLDKSNALPCNERPSLTKGKAESACGTLTKGKAEAACGGVSASGTAYGASMLVTFVIGMVCLLIALKPPSVIVWINLFAFGGLQTAFFWTFILGLFWKRANATGALFAMVGGVAAYCLCMALREQIPLGGFHQIVVGIASSLILFITGSLFGKPPKDNVTKVFFP